MRETKRDRNRKKQEEGNERRDWIVNQEGRKQENKRKIYKYEIESFEKEGKNNFILRIQQNTFICRYISAFNSVHER